MRQSLLALLANVIDYAGLFPPAKLEMGSAVEQYLGYRSSADRWLVNRFVCSAARLPELAVELRKHPDADLVEVAVVGAGGKDRAGWEEGLTSDVARMNAFEQACDGKAIVGGFEVRLPNNTEVSSWIADLKGFDNVDVFAETAWDEHQHGALAVLAEAEWLGAKGRTGGIEPGTFPSADQVAGFLQQCSQLDLAFKLTAGLHSPVALGDPLLGEIHGFLNLLAATALLHAHDLTRKEVVEVLQERSGKAFSFSETGLSWKAWKATMDDIDSARAIFQSFGSCSVEEPLEGMRKFGLL